jgi:hypothetical protein
VIDTLRSVAGGLKEEKAEEVRAFFNKFKSLKDSGVAVIFLDHCRKPQQHEGKRPKKEQLFASQDKLASVEVLLMVRSEGRSEEIFVYPMKNRSGLERKPFKVTMKDEETGIRMFYAGDFEEDLTKKDEAKDFILAVLSEGGKITSEIITIAKSERSIGAKSTRQALKELVEDSELLMRKQGISNYYEVSANSQLPAEEDHGNLFGGN